MFAFEKECRISFIRFLSISYSASFCILCYNCCFLFPQGIYKDLDALGKAVVNGDECSSHLDMFSLEMFENIAYIMAKHADSTIPEEWLDEFSPFSIYQVLPKIIELWALTVQTDVESKKTSRNRSADGHAIVSAPLRTARHLHPGS